MFGSSPLLRNLFHFEMAESKGVLAADRPFPIKTSDRTVGCDAGSQTIWQARKPKY
jgi:hypothetical protein